MIIRYAALSFQEAAVLFPSAGYPYLIVSSEQESETSERGTAWRRQCRVAVSFVSVSRQALSLEFSAGKFPRSDGNSSKRTGRYHESLAHRAWSSASTTRNANSASSTNNRHYKNHL